MESQSSAANFIYVSKFWNSRIYKGKAAASRAESARQYDSNVHGPTNYGLGSDGQQSYDSGQGFGTNATTGGPVSNKTGRGRTDYMDGGLADMLEIYDWL